MKVDRLSTDGKLFGGDKSFVLIKVGRVSNNGDRVLVKRVKKLQLSHCWYLYGNTLMRVKGACVVKGRGYCV